jgi:hypothetical protein
VGGCGWRCYALVSKRFAHVWGSVVGFHEVVVWEHRDFILPPDVLLSTLVHAECGRCGAQSNIVSEHAHEAEGRLCVSVVVVAVVVAVAVAVAVALAMVCVCACLWVGG